MNGRPEGMDVLGGMKKDFWGSSGREGLALYTPGRIADNTKTRWTIMARAGLLW